jgi:hypothetical protein
MVFDGSVSSRLNHRATHSANHSGSVDPCVELDNTKTDRVQNEAITDDGFKSRSSAARSGGLVRSMARVLERGWLAMQGVHSPCEYLAPLAQSFARVPDELGLSSEIRFRVIVVGRPKSLKPSLQDEVYRIGREAILNAYRHSRASVIEMEIQYRPASIRLAVRDNGCGIDPQKLTCGHDQYWGLLGMRERAERLGARFRVLSGIALGTEVELYVAGSVVFEANTAAAAW